MSEGFNPRPAEFGWATPCRNTFVRWRRVSIHAQPSLAGRPGIPAAVGKYFVVSIHAQPSLAGRRRCEAASARTRSFQSTPSRVWLGDTTRPQVSGSITWFQSTPSRVWLGDFWSGCCRFECARFQSTPSRVWLGDYGGRGRCHDLDAGFNPRPAEFGWATVIRDANAQGVIGFQSTPSRVWLGDRAHGGAAIPMSSFNPRPAEFGWATSAFLDDPQRRAVSIHAQPSLAGRLDDLRSVVIFGGFNPRPAEFGWATRHQGEPAAVLLFQSTPSRVWLGDSQSSGIGETVACFNPRPAEFGWATGN